MLLHTYYYIADIGYDIRANMLLLWRAGMPRERVDMVLYFMFTAI